MIAALLSSMAVAGLALAGEPLTPAEAEAYNEAAKIAQSGDPARGHECAVTLTELAQRLGDKHSRTVEALELAARCHEAAGEYEAMVATRERLVEKFPATPTARVAMLALVRHHRATLAFEKAAAVMERFAERWPGEREAIDLLQEAFVLRAQLGHDKRALELSERMEKLYAGKDPQRLALIYWARADLLPKTLPDDQARQAHAAGYLQRYGNKGGPARRIVAEVTYAAIEWRRACKQKDGLMDLCVSVKPAAPDAPKGGKAPRLTCAGPAAQAITVHPRDRKLAESAQRRLREAVSLGEILPPVEDPWLRAKVDEALDQAELILADAKLEEALAVRPPADLSFFREDWREFSDDARDRKIYAEQKRKSEDSTRRFLDYWNKSQERTNDLNRRYEKVAARKRSVRGMFAAAARNGIVSQTQVDTLMAAEVPAGLKSDAAIKAYCGALADSTGPIATAAMQAFEYCWQRSAMFAYTDPSVEFCGAELQRRQPRAYPPQRELFGFIEPPPLEPVSAPVQVEPPILEQE
ncbi:hypothetical protein [Nannocystis sp. SCPEA4]|uniref:tetratricopeptide repeat protein n=1 Tax=Nannocystis sp. SCPEA4 TaxID=2996787 RepID=UPI002271342A|nr:hypothetical protein [Nannocystis sp. SCPEA4]MCY1056447.1 hypothetical protein [Nannocystis sp. SCPEA4]